MQFQHQVGDSLQLTQKLPWLPQTGVAASNEFVRNSSQKFMFVFASLLLVDQKTKERNHKPPTLDFNTNNSRDSKVHLLFSVFGTRSVARKRTEQNPHDEPTRDAATTQSGPTRFKL
jgi:hypothetical protein